MVSEKTAVALGYFDSLHLGHKEVIKCAVNSKILPAVFTFYSETGKKGEKPFLDEETKRNLIEEMGVKVYACPPFSEIKGLSYKEFFDEILVKRLSASLLVCGEDFRFGKDREGDTEKLSLLCKERGITLITVPILTKNNKKISTTEIRALIENGEILLAEELLGRKI